MASWLDYSNLYINLSTMHRVNELSLVQKIATERMFALEDQKVNDNNLLSKLVDIYVKVREFFQGRQYFDGIMTIGLGVLAFKNIYPQIIDANTKLKASDIQVKLIETLNSIIKDSEIKNILTLAISDYLMYLRRQVDLKYEELKNTEFKHFYLDTGQDYEFDPEEECTPDKDLMNLQSKALLFKKYIFYNIIEVKQTKPWGFYVINENGQKHFLHFGLNGGAETFIFFDPPMPTLRKEIYDWRLFDTLFSESFLNENLRTVSQEMFLLSQEAYIQAKTTKTNIEDNLSKFENFRKKAVERLLQRKELKEETQIEKSDNASTKILLAVALIIIISLIVFFIFR